MADTLVREAIAYGSQPLSPVPQYWNGTSYEKVQGANGATRGINYNSSGTEIFTATTQGSVKLTSTSTVAISGNITSVISGTATVLVSGTATVNFSGTGTIEIVSSSGGTAYFSSTNPGFTVNKVTGSQGNAWNSVSVNELSASNSIDLQYNYNVSYFGTVSNTASLTLYLQASQDNLNFYMVESHVFTSGTTSEFFYSILFAPRYARLITTGVSATITATIAGK